MQKWLGPIILAVLLGSQPGDGAARGVPRRLVVSPQGVYTSIQEALAQAQNGDTIQVQGGTYPGPLLVTKRVKLIGRDWPVVDGGNRGTVVKLTAPGVLLQGFVIQNSGKSLDAENSGIAVEAPGARIRNNRLRGTLFGIYLRKAPDSIIQDNVIHSKPLAVPRRGDAIRVWYSNGVRIERNVVEKGRDVVLWYSGNLQVRGNTVTAGRYGLHFMYCDDALIQGNRLTHNSVGAFLMYSRRLHLRRNVIGHNRGPSGYGVGLKDMDDAVIEENLFLDNRVGAFVDNSPREIDSTSQFRGNVFAFNDIGVNLLPSVRRNFFTTNSFVDNQEQVGIAGGGRLRGNHWTVHRRGNYWSDYVGYDANQDGVGDVVYRAERLFEDLMDRHPPLRLFVYSPAVQAMDFATRAFPMVKPQPKLTDTRPLMRPVLPTGLPTIPRPTAHTLGLTSAALVMIAAAVAFWPRFPRRHRKTARTRPGRDTEIMVHMHELTKRFGTLIAVDHLSCDIGSSQAVALWGPNGAGKTTVLRCLLGLLPFAGTVCIAGYDVRTEGKAARHLVGFVPQELHLHDDLTVQETMRFYARLKKTSAAPMAQLLERLGLTAYIDRPVRDLSGGMKQRLALALALVADPLLLVLDEPTTNLDAGARDDFLALLAEVKATGKTLIFSSHRIDEVASLADRVLVMEHGKRVADCPPSDLSRRLGWKTLLRLYVPPESIEAALAILVQHGFSVRRNGKGIQVDVAPHEKGMPIGILAQARIPVRDFDLEPLNGER